MTGWLAAGTAVPSASPVQAASARGQGVVLGRSRRRMALDGARGARRLPGLLDGCHGPRQLAQERREPDPRTLPGARR